MNVGDPLRVHVVLDPSFGQRLADLPVEEPVWIVASPNNEPIIRELWQQRPAESHLDGITSFQPYSGSPEQKFLGMLGTVDRHHGEDSATPTYSRLEIVGCPASEDIRSALSEFGFVISATTPEGFSARRLTSIT